MLDDIRFTMAAVAKKAVYVQELTHFRIKDGRITGFNGVMALSSPIAVDLDVRPNAAKFLAAVKACEGTIALHVTPGGKLTVRSGKFKAHVDCLPDEGQIESLPQGELVGVNESFLKGLRLLSPLMGIDASRPWAMGIKVREQSMFATNNVLLAQYWHGSPFPHDVVIPARAIDELLRIGTPPTKVQVCETSVTFWFGEDRWLKTNLLEGNSWPLERMEELMNGTQGPEQTPFPEAFFDDLQTLKPFLDDANPAVYLTPGGISTSLDEGAGASVEVALPQVTDPQAYSFQQLEILGQVASAVDWRGYPKPCMFTHGDEPLRGVIVGRRL